jgi:hypothetical protein
MIEAVLGQQGQRGVPICIGFFFLFLLFLLFLIRRMRGGRAGPAAAGQRIVLVGAAQKRRSRVRFL